MARYVCDFDTVIQIGKDVCAAAEEMSSAVSTYNSQIEESLSSWSGMAKNAFTSTNTDQVKNANDDLTHVRELGEFIQTSAQAIESLEEQLAALSI